MSYVFIVALTGALMAMSASGIDIMVPAMLDIGHALDSDPRQVQLAIPVYLIAFGGGQLFFGPLSDRFGRRIIVFLGLSLFVFGCAVSSFAPSIEVFLFGRFIQGLAGASGPVLGRAILRDLYKGRRLAETMAWAMMIFTIAPIAAPLLGNILLEIGHWRFVFWGLGSFALLLMFLVCFFFQETLQKEDRRPISLPFLYQACREVCVHRQSRFFILVGALAVSPFMCFLATAPVIYATEFQATGFVFTAAFALKGVGAVFGQRLNIWMIRAFGALAAVRFAVLGTALSSFAILFLTISGLLTYWSLTVSMIIFLTFFTPFFSNVMSLSIDPHQKVAGMASSLTGFGTQSLGGLLGMGLIVLYQGRTVVWAMELSLLTALSALCVFLLWKGKTTAG